MSSKYPRSSLASVQPKKSRKSLSLDKKLQIITRREKGEGVNAIARSLALSQSTVSTVIKNKEAIKTAAQGATSLQARTLTKQREPIFEEMERCLSSWIREETSRSMPLNMEAISEKALELFHKLQEDGWEVKEGTQFKASKGWFDRFKNRAGLHTVELYHEDGFTDVEEQDVDELLDVHDQPLSIEDLVQVEEQQALAEDKEEEDKKPKGLTVAKLCKVLNGMDMLMGVLQDADPNLARSANAVQGVNDALKVYREMYQHKKQLAKQSSITSFFKSADR